MIPVLGLGVLIAKAATVAAIPRAVTALRAFFCEPKSVERTSTSEKSPQSKTPSAIPPTGTKAVVFTHNSLNQRTSPGTNLYDAKGQTKDQAGRQFEWDDDGRCTAILMGTHRSEFAYDGYGRRVRITEKENNVVQSDRLYFWLGGQIVCERDALQPGNPITKRFFAQGLIANGTKLYYTFDQLGSSASWWIRPGWCGRITATPPTGSGPRLAATSIPIGAGPDCGTTSPRGWIWRPTGFMTPRWAGGCPEIRWARGWIGRFTATVGMIQWGVWILKACGKGPFRE